MRKRELVALLDLSSWCLVMVERLFLAVPRGCLRFVIVVFPDHTLLLFMVRKYHNHTLQTNPRHHAEEQHDIRKTIKVRQPALSLPHQDDLRHLSSHSSILIKCSNYDQTEIRDHSNTCTSWHTGRKHTTQVISSRCWICCTFYFHIDILI